MTTETPNSSIAKSVKISPHPKPLSGSVIVPGSKSLTNRALMLAGVAKGVSNLSNILYSDDTKMMITALKQMGVKITSTAETTLQIESSGQLQAPNELLYLGNAGTATRFLSAMCCLVKGDVTIDGDSYMQVRPIQPLVNALISLGVEVDCPTGCPPLTIKGQGGFPNNQVEIDAGLSSQYVSALLMLAPFAQTSSQSTSQDSSKNNSQSDFMLNMTQKDIGGRGYINLTLDLMKKFGVHSQANDLGWQVAPQSYQATDYTVEPDASSATYLWAMEALTQGQIDIGYQPEQMTQPDAKVYDIIRQFPDFPDVIDGSQFQDAVPTLAVMAAFTNKKIRFTGIENLRVKECDRVSALREGLCQIHNDLAEEQGDDLIVYGDLPIRSLTDTDRAGLDIIIDSKDDHRIAMCFALAGLFIEGISISNPNCVAKTYPNYWQHLQHLGVDLTFNY